MRAPCAHVCERPTGADQIAAYSLNSGLGSDRLFRLTKIQGSELLTLDLLEVDSTENATWQSQNYAQIAGRRAGVLSREGLIKMKSYSTRTKDRLDIELLSEEQTGGPDDGLEAT